MEQKTAKGFIVKKREYNKNCYLKHICAKETNLMAELLASRGIDVNEKENFFNPKLKNLLPKPDILKNVDKASDRILTAIQNKEKICIYGDYDVDGTTSTSMLLLWFEKLGITADYYIPDRLTEGYGANVKAMEKIASAGVKLIIFVDCGITANEPIKVATDLGVDVIVLDHHKSGDELPSCIACVDANREDEKDLSNDLHCLCACGVSFITLMACNKLLKENGFSTPDLMHFVPLVAFATICDVMQLTPLNRAFVKTGLSVLENEKMHYRCDIKNKEFNCKTFNIYKLFEAEQKARLIAKQQFTGNIAMPNISAYSFGFILGPMVNAGGRIGKSDLGVRLLTANNISTAQEIAEELQELNDERKNIETQALEDARRKKEEIQKQIEKQGFILLFSKDWHEGVIGLVASRIKDKYYYPTIIGSENDNGLIKFSCRSIDGIDIGKVILLAVEEGILINGGGHEMAGGFSCKKENIEKLKEFFAEYIKDKSKKQFNEKTIYYDTAMSLSGLSIDFVDYISQLEPFGIGNAKPIYLIQDVNVFDVRVLKDKHIMLVIGDEQITQRAICFNCIGTDFGNTLLSSKGKTINILATAESDEWQGKRRLNIRIEDVIV